MTTKKWIFVFLMFNLAVISLLSLANYLIDPFNIFHTNLLKHEFQMNERFMKIEHLDKNKQKYNSYLFGSSRVGTTDTKDIEKYIPNSKFYNLTVSSANLQDHLKHLTFFINNNYSIKNLYLQIDLDNIFLYGHSEDDYLRKLHPYVQNESLWQYYASYLPIFPYQSAKGKIEQNIHPDDRYYDLINTGAWYRHEKEKQLLINPKEYIKNESSFHVLRPLEDGVNKKFSLIIDDLKHIISLCKSEQIHLILLITPHNQNMMKTFSYSMIDRFYKEVIKYSNFWDFSGFNSITLNNENYYDRSHYRRKVGKLMLAKIFDKDHEISDDFGTLVTKENIKQHLQALHKQMQRYNPRAIDSKDF